MAKSANNKRSASSFDTLLDYEERSLAHVPGRPESIEAPGHWRGVGFRLGQRRFVSSFDEVMEILALPPVTPVPGSQPWMLGVANVRDFGDLITSRPRWITQGRAGAGFVELAEALLAARA